VHLAFNKFYVFNLIDDLIPGFYFLKSLAHFNIIINTLVVLSLNQILYIYLSIIIIIIIITVLVLTQVRFHSLTILSLYMLLIIDFTKSFFLNFLDCLSLYQCY
jgi:hypothetical protein